MKDDKGKDVCDGWKCGKRAVFRALRKGDMAKREWCSVCFANEIGTHEYTQIERVKQ